MKYFIKKTGVVGIVSISVPVLVIISIFFPDDSHIGFSIFLVAVSLLQIFDQKTDAAQGVVENIDLIECCRKSEYLMLAISVIYAGLLITLKNHVVLISSIALIGYFINGFMLYRKVEKIKK